MSLLQALARRFNDNESSGRRHAQAMMQKGEAPASVQCAALRALGHVLGTIQSMPLSDAKIFNEYGSAHAALPALHIYSWPDSNQSCRWRKKPCSVAKPSSCSTMH